MNDVADKWKELGVQLLRSDQENRLKIIAADHPHDVVSCCKRVLEKWLDTTTDATWNQLITALRRPSVQLDYLANQLEQMLSTECKIMVMAGIRQVDSLLSKNQALISYTTVNLLPFIIILHVTHLRNV